MIKKPDCKMQFRLFIIALPRYGKSLKYYFRV